MTYKPDEVSLNAERINLFCERKKAVRALMKRKNERSLWNTVVAFQNYPFHTATGLQYVYELKKGRDGEYNRELIVSKCKESKR